MEFVMKRLRERRIRGIKDYQASLEKLRKDAAENRLISDLATDKAKRAMFAKLADHLNALADEVERAMAAKEIEEDS
jgi:uncharacterized protein YdcH (DUF465 family)